MQCMPCRVWSPVEQYSASDIARVATAFTKVMLAASVAAKQAASREAERALLDETSSRTPAASHRASTCKHQ